MRNPEGCLLAALLGVLYLAGRARGHGTMLLPVSRQIILWQMNLTDMPNDIGRGGGSKVVSKGNTLMWPQGVHTPCGDAPGETLVEVPGQITASYLKGSAIEMSYFITTNHLGRFKVQICTLGAKSEAECSAPLQRADGKGTWWWLPNRGFYWYSGSAGYDGYDYFDGSYKMTDFGGFEQYCKKSYTCNCTSNNNCTMYERSSVFTTKWRLPSSGPFATCDHCVLRTYWITAHTCVPPCTREHPNFPDCKKGSLGGLPQEYCGTRLDAYPEEYWSCGDIRITADPAGVTFPPVDSKPYTKADSNGSNTGGDGTATSNGDGSASRGEALVATRTPSPSASKAEDGAAPAAEVATKSSGARRLLAAVRSWVWVTHHA